MNNRKLVLENGKVFEGKGFGSLTEVVCELTFNTAVVGYQEMISDPANYNKMRCLENHDQPRICSFVKDEKALILIIQ